MHPDIEPLGFLVGRWRGSGTGDYPTIERFSYREEVEITATAKPVLRYEQRTADPAAGTPMHAETGWLRLAAHGAELVVAQPTGIVEVHSGRLDGHRLLLSSDTVATTASASGHRVRQVERIIAVEGDVMTYRLSMAAAGQPFGLHLQAELHRV